MNFEIWNFKIVNGIGIDKQSFEQNIVDTRAAPLNRGLCSYLVLLTSNCH